MYDNPIYRWREAVAVALSMMQAKPLHGYVAYRSISDYLNHHGLAIKDGEADPMPTAAEVSALIFDAPRLEKVIQDASRVPVDNNLAPVPIRGNEKGPALYYYWAFELFGINLTALWLLYFLALGASVVVFWLSFRQSPFSILILMFLLIGHFYLVGYAARLAELVTLHNARFLPVLAVIPTAHLLLLLHRREQLSPLRFAGAAAQTFLLLFAVFCRFQAIWQLLAVVASAVQVVSWRSLWQSVRRPRLLGVLCLRAGYDTWPAVLAIVGYVGLQGYMAIALDRQAYRTEASTHTFWDPVYGGTISASSELFALYSYGEARYGDNLSYEAALSYLRARNDASPAIAYTSDGVIMIDAMRNMGVFDQLMRRIFFETVAEHPWLVLKSFLYDKPHIQAWMFSRVGVFSPGSYRWVFPMALATTVIALWAGASVRREEVMRALGTIALVIPFSLITTEVLPSVLIPDALDLYLLIAMLGFIYLPMAALPPAWRHITAVYTWRGARRR